VVTKKHKATDPSSMDSTSEGNNAWCALQNTHINNIASAIAQLDAKHLIDEGCLSPQPQKKTDFTFGSPPKNNTSTGKVSRNHYQGPTVKPGCLKSISSLKKAATSTESTTASTSTCHNKLSITDFVDKEASRPRGVSPPRGSN
jgi:hypothetical protein